MGGKILDGALALIAIGLALALVAPYSTSAAALIIVLATVVGAVGVTRRPVGR